MPWRVVGSSMLASLMIGSAFPSVAGATPSLVSEEKSVVRGTEVCGIAVRDLSYLDAKELGKNGFKYGKDYTYDASREMYVPRRIEVREGVGKMLLALQLRGVDVNQLVDKKLQYSIVKADMKDILGHAFVWQGKPEIYLYGKYVDFWEGVETEATIVHEFGHYVEARYMSDLDRRIAYAKLRGLPDSMVYMTQDGAEWGDLFEEIFAEDYKSLFVEGAIFKANQKPLSVAKRAKLMEMIVGWMIADMEPSRNTAGALGTVRSSGVVNEDDVLFCNDQAGYYLTESVSGSEFVNWMVEMYYAKSVRVGKVLTKKDVDQEIHKRYGFYPSEVDALTSVQYREMLAYFRELVDGYVKGRDTKRLNTSIASAGVVVPRKYSAYTKRVLGSAMYLRMANVMYAKSYRDGKVTRGEMASWIVKSKRVPRVTSSEAAKILRPYKDVSAKSVYGRDVATVIKKKWMFGVKKGTFGYSHVVTKEQSAYLIGKAHVVADVGSSKKSFADMKGVSKAYVKDVTSLRRAGVLVGDANNKFNPTKPLSRTALIGMITRLGLLETGTRVRDMYIRDGIASVYKTQEGLRKWTGTKLTKRDVIKWMK